MKRTLSAMVMAAMLVSRHLKQIFLLGKTVGDGFPYALYSFSEAGAVQDEELSQILHFYLLNRGMLITLFHNMMLLFPQTDTTTVAKLLRIFTDFIGKWPRGKR